MKLAIVTTHPIQYNAPWFRLLAARGEVTPRVFYTWSQSAEGAKFDPDFGRKIEWDIPLLEGYEYQFVDNVAKDPGTHHFKGIINPTLVNEITDWEPDAILVFGWSFRSHLQCLRFFHRKIPVLFRGDSTLLDELPGWRTRARRIFLRWVYKNVDYALYTGINNREYFAIHGLEDDQLVFAPHAIDNARFTGEASRLDAEARAWRQKLGISDEDLVVLFAGKLEPKKNPAFLLAMAAAIPDPRLKFVLVGNGVLESSLRAAAAADPRILFLDFQNQQQMPLVYRLGDVFILPSKGPGETWGLAVNEAMACGRAVIVSNKTGCAVDLVRNGENGLIVDPANPGAAIDFLRRALEDRGQLAAMGQRSKAIVAKYSFDTLIDSLITLLNRIK